jgi:hypothetical protein
MAVNETVGINLVADTKSLRSQLREATQELVALQNSAGATGAEIAEAAKRAADLKDRIGDAKATIEAFDPDAKFKAFGQSIQGVAGAFAATQGALALVGVESAEVEKQLLKVQSALALSEGLNTVLASIDGFKNLGLVIKTNVLSAFASMKAAAITAFTTMRGALIATGIGAFAVALGLIVSNFDAIKAAALRLIPGLGNVGKLFGEIVTKVTDFVGITNEADRALEKFTKTSERKKEALENEIKIRQAAGASVKELSDLERKIINEDLEVLRRKSKTKDGLTTEEQKKFRSLKAEELVIEAKVNKSIADENAKRIQKVTADNVAAAQKNKERQEKELQEFLDASQKRADRLNELNKTEKTEFEKRLITLKEQYDADLKLFGDSETLKLLAKKAYDEAVFKATKAEKERIRNLEDKDGKERIEKLEKERDKKEKEDTKTNSMITKAMDKSLANDKAITNAKKKLAEEEKNARIAAAMATADTLASLSNLLGQETAAGKAAAVASATISAILSAQKAYESTIGIPYVGPILAPINAGLALASGYKSIQNILAVKVPGEGGGGSAPSLGSAPSAGSGAPIAPRGMDPIPTSLDQASLNTISNVTTRAYVVESDITGSQKRIERIEKASRF